MSRAGSQRLEWRSAFLGGRHAQDLSETDSTRTLILVLSVAVFLVSGGCGGEHVGPGVPIEKARPVPPAAETGPQILFGDLHTHTQFSLDAWPINLPILGGEGAHPPADACDFARYCSALDFWSINDHAEGLTPRHWQETREAVRACNAATNPANPDLVTFLGWEWSQVGTTAENHFGHKNVVLLETEDSETPPRPMSAPRPEFRGSPISPLVRWLLPIMDFENRDYYTNWSYRYEELDGLGICAADVPSTELPTDCLEVARDPEELFRKLDEQGAEALVIPHGTTWGLMTPPSTEIASQLSQRQHRPDRQKLFEIYSGHGSAELYREFRSEGRDNEGNLFCPEPSENYTPCCWRAGQIIRERCEGPDSERCEQRVRAARQDFVDAGVAGYQTVPGVTASDWLDCGACPDCPLGAFDHRPTASAQAALAAAPRDGSDRRFRFGFLGSSDTHRAKPGNGYKEFARTRTSDSIPSLKGLLGQSEEPGPESRRVVLDELPLANRRYIERQSPFYLTGGLVAVVAENRTREGIWQALSQRSVYGTSGPRILLAFDLLQGGGAVPMGTDLEFSGTPTFRATASGARVQKPGCPEDVHSVMTPERLEALCAGECHNPGDERVPIRALEVVRIRPQRTSEEPIGALIEDPWRSFPCPVGSEACSVEFEDPEYESAQREVVYYMRAVQQPTPAIGGDPLRCDRDAEGRCIEVNLCGKGEDPEEECLSPVSERAWSSPIFLRPPTGREGSS